MDRDKILNKAKLGLMTKNIVPNGNPIFYSSILFSLKVVWTTDIPTAAVDGKNLYINEDWFCILKFLEQIGLLAHEVLHIGLRHIDSFHLYNKKKYSLEIEHSLWNEAGDYVINYLLTKVGYTIPRGGLLDNRFNDMATFQVYDILHSEIDITTYVINDGDIIYPSDVTAADKRKLDTLTKDITAVLSKAKLNADLNKESIGSLPAELLRTLKLMIDPPLSLEVILSNYMSRYNKDDYSYRKPNRRFLPDLYLPGSYNESLCNIVAAFDVSGSVTDEQLSSFRNSVRIIQEQLKPEQITLIQWSVGIDSIKVMDSHNDIMDIEFIGGGGTNIQDLIYWIRDNKSEVTLIFTDGDFHIPNFNGVCTDIIWLIEGNTEWSIPYGKIIHYSI